MSLPLAEEQVQKLPLEFADEKESVNITGFWMFLVTDVLVFGSLFSTYAVMRHSYAMGPTADQLFKMGPVMLETLLLLTSSFTIGLGVFAMRKGQTRALMFWLLLTMLLGAGFVTTEIHDFVSFAAIGATWHTSAFLSAFDILVGTHGAHVTFGIFWALTLLLQLRKRGITARTARKIYTFSLYWHFLDIVWIFIFTFVYLNGKIV
ncbi:MAG: cytochrome o ubiquinol oxidase subunit III [Sulfobacillus acidophilus]|uniref:Cytochrome o ubiquinol oxidase subunit III n=1 Tax=Sulfobacillus acidophilus TaxID=53633 RepID=A0A2T2WK68_9FIRM|nr:MAG: cytochrome o ubiquinol oxidase subunit III [Sulfobacillus acidophilus]